MTCRTPVQCAQADPGRSRAARPSGAGGFLLVLTLLVALLGLTACDDDVEITPPRAGENTSSQRAEEAQQSLDDLVRAIRSGGRDDAVATAVSGSRDLLGWVHDNAADLHIGDLSLRYVDEGSALDQRQQVELGPDAWRGTVQLTYRYQGYDASPARLETSVVFVPSGERVQIASFGGAGERTPLWLADRLSVVRTPRTLLAVASDSPGRYPGLAARAVRQVSRMLPDWSGRLLVEVPASRAELDAALEAQSGQYDNIAAVTTSADGSLAPDAPVRVFVNPQVFGRLKARGAQVVMSHETTHVATGAPFASMPTWLLEGFADFVALDHAGVPVDLAARQILARIRKEGLPRGLPTSQDLDPSANGLGATYEEAWLACRFLAQEHGARALVRFYRRVDGGASTQEAFRSVLGTSQQQFVSRWRQDLARLAGVAG
jgi:hypothetical protein